MERLYKELERYGKSDFYPFHMPGHKRNSRCVDGEFPLERDITEISGFDNLHHPVGIIRDSQEALTRLCGTKASFFSVNGSTAALLAAISASVTKGGQILMARNCHKAVYHGVYLRDLHPTYLYPQADPELGINDGISPCRVERCLESNENIEAVLITSPTYDGVVSDVKKIAEIAHSHGIPLIVDEAHGAHFMFSDYFPESAVSLGADLVIQSFHKTLMSMTQTAVLHCCSDRVDLGKIKRFLGIYQTSSPSYILMASLDACVDKLEQDKEKLFAKFTRNLERAREALSGCRYIRLITPGPETPLSHDVHGNPACLSGEALPQLSNVFDFDRSKIILSTVHSTLNGVQLAEILREEFHIEVEMETENYVIALAAVGDTEEGFARLLAAVKEIDAREAEKAVASEAPVRAEAEEDNFKCAVKKQMMSISDAMDAPVKKCPLEDSAGQISAEFAYLYPPGIPLLVPGEQITGLFVRNVRRYMEQGLSLQGLADVTNATIRVVKE